MTFSKMAGSLIGSEVLKIAGEINALKAEGKQIVNFTVGDFDPKQFPIPERLRDLIIEAYKKGDTNYPPSSGVADLRRAIADFYSREFDVPTSSEEVLVAGGARPLIYTTFAAFLNPGDEVVYPVPSWNNNHYCHLLQAKPVALTCLQENGFMPTADEIRPAIGTARLLCLNSPLNPTGTVFSEQALLDVCRLVVDENKKRATRAQPPVMMMFDQIYWRITHGNAKHAHPLRLCPEVKPYTVFIDGVSKYFCATGLRVGWMVLPKELMGPFSSLLGHIGAWAPKPEQAATAQFLGEHAAIDEFSKRANAALERRLTPLFDGIMALKKEGLPIDAVRPQGGIYLSVRFGQGPFRSGSNEEMRKRLLQDAGIAVVPFNAFGMTEDSGWFRLSVGAVSEADVADVPRRLRAFFARS